jgi:hypothetical protein
MLEARIADNKIFLLAATAITYVSSVGIVKQDSDLREDFNLFQVRVHIDMEDSTRA